MLFLKKALPLADKTHLLYDKLVTLIYYELTLLCLKQKQHADQLKGYLNILRQLDFEDSYQALFKFCSRHLDMGTEMT